MKSVVKVLLGVIAGLVVAGSLMPVGADTDAAQERLVVDKTTSSAWVTDPTLNNTEESILGDPVAFYRTTPAASFLLTVEGPQEQGLWRIYREDLNGVALVRTIQWFPSKPWLNRQFVMGDFLGRWIANFRGGDTSWRYLWRQPCDPFDDPPVVVMYVDFPDGGAFVAQAERCEALNIYRYRPDGSVSSSGTGSLWATSMHQNAFDWFVRYELTYA